MTELANTVSAITTAINGVMNEATQSENRQAALVIALFESEASFSNDALLNFLRKEKAEKTEARRKLIMSISDEFKAAIELVNVLNEKGKKGRNEKDNFQLEGFNKKIRAADIMFERAAVTVVGMRENGVQSAKLSRVGAGAIEYKYKDAEGDLVKDKASASALNLAGTKVVDKLIGKAAKTTTTANPAQGNGMKGMVEAVSRFIEVSQKDATAPVKCLADFSDDIETEMEKLFDRMFQLKFGGAIADVKDITTYVKSLTKGNEDKKAA